MRRPALAPLALALLGVALVLLAAGCGLGSGEGAREVSVTVTRDFGERKVGSAHESETKGSETVMRFLQRRFDVRTRYGGGFVQAIDGLTGGYQGGRPVDWFYYVNGIEASKGAAAVDHGAHPSGPTVMTSLPPAPRS